MKLVSALRWAAIYRGIVWAAGLLPLGVAVVALYFAGPNRLPRGTGDALGAMSNPSVLAPVLVALVVWQFVKTAAFYKTVAEATDEQMSERFDSEKVKSDILEVLDDRLAEMHDDLQRTRREVQQTDSGGGATSGPTTTTGAGSAGDSSSFDFEG